MKKKIYSVMLRTYKVSCEKSSWTVSLIYSHYTIEQEGFKEKFVNINQDSRQNTKSSVQKDFYKLMNYSNFS